MAELRRAFLAVVPPPSIIGWTESVVAAAHVDGLRWSRPEQRHLTLHFLGAVPDPEQLGASVGEIVRGHAPFSISLGGGGAFPDERHASVLWLGVRDGGDALTALAESLGPLDRPYRPHLTLARAPKTRDLRATVAALDGCGDSDAWIVDEIVLFDSKLASRKGRADGAVHTEVARFKLAG